MTVNAVAAIWVTSLGRTHAVRFRMSSLGQFLEVVSTKRLFEPSFGESSAALKSHDYESNKETLKAYQTCKSEYVRVLVWQSDLIKVAIFRESNLLNLM